MQRLFCVSVTLLVLITYAGCLGGSRSGLGGSMKASKYTGSIRPAVYNGAGNTQPYSKETNKTTSKSPSPTKRNSGMSAWGIIAIVLSVIFISMGSYYTFIFYPLLCKKERNYDIIELSNV